MFDYTFDDETGGIILGNECVNKDEPRPVYALEMDYLGFNKHYSYDSQNNYPYLWKVKANYFYRGIKIASVRGGDCFNPPALVLDSPLFYRPGKHLKPIDVSGMVYRNAEKIGAMEKAASESMLSAVEDFYRNEGGLVTVAYSGGKDSQAVLSLARKSLAKDKYIIVFGDTTMESRYTYDIIRAAEKDCREDGVRFFQARSRLGGIESWQLFGPPANMIRWCHIVHKITPSILLNRRLDKVNSGADLTIVGCRALESFKRSKYQYIEKDKRQQYGSRYRVNAILNWTSAEVWLYNYYNHNPVNYLYKCGFDRVGCIACPYMRGKKNHLLATFLAEEYTPFVDYIKSVYKGKDEEFYITNNWGGRRSGKMLEGVRELCSVDYENKALTITVENPSTDWREWMKMIGTLKRRSPGEYTVKSGNTNVDFSVLPVGGGYVVKTETPVNTSSFTKYFRRVFKKAAYCVGCQYCEALCSPGVLRFVKGKPRLKRNCDSCTACFDMNEGCVRAYSLRVPKGQ